MIGEAADGVGGNKFFEILGGALEIEGLGLAAARAFAVDVERL